MDDFGHEKINKIRQIANAIRTALRAGAEAYANGRAGAKPIVDRHYTAGNQSRYGWPPLSQGYFRQKAGSMVAGNGGSFGLTPEQTKELHALDAKHRNALSLWRTKKGASQEEVGDNASFRKSQVESNKDERAKLIQKFAGGRTLSRVDKEAQHSTPFGGVTGVGKNLPMLVRTSALRHAVSGTKHVIAAMRGDMVVVSFRGLPSYATYLQNGTATMPARSPVRPGAADRQEVIAVMRRHMDAALATGGKVANGTPMQNAGARMA